jgi:hypothetical protein
MRTLHSSLVLLAAVSMLLSGCLGEESPKSSDQAADPEVDARVTVVGVVKEVNDATPHDGGVEIWLKLEEGGEVQLLFGSLFTYPPPDDETLKLYEVIRRVQVGDRVQATGTETARGIRIEQLTILK